MYNASIVTDIETAIEPIKIPERFVNQRPIERIITKDKRRIAVPTATDFEFPYLIIVPWLSLLQAIINVQGVIICRLGFCKD